MEYFKALRPHQGVRAVLLTLVGFRVASHWNVWYTILVVLNVLITVGAIMVWNDYRDRVQDVLKGKSLAYDNPKKYLQFSIRLWCFSGILSAALLLFSYKAFLLAIGMNLIGCLYSVAIIKIPILPTFTVAGLSAAVTLYPACVPGGRNSTLPYLALITFCLIFAREIMSDIGDVEVDREHKITIPMLLGEDGAKVCVLFALLAVIGSALAASPIIGGTLAVGIFIYVREVVMYQLIADGYKEARGWLDLLNLLMMTAFLVFGKL